VAEVKSANKPSGIHKKTISLIGVWKQHVLRFRFPMFSTGLLQGNILKSIPNETFLNGSPLSLE